MEVTTVRQTRFAATRFAPDEWLRIELYAEKCGLKVGDVVESVIKYGYKEFFNKVNSH